MKISHSGPAVFFVLSTFYFTEAESWNVITTRKVETKLSAMHAGGECIMDIWWQRNECVASCHPLTFTMNYRSYYMRMMSEKDSFNSLTKYCISVTNQKLALGNATAQNKQWSKLQPSFTYTGYGSCSGTLDHKILIEVWARTRVKQFTFQQQFHYVSAFKLLWNSTVITVWNDPIPPLEGTTAASQNSCTKYHPHPTTTKTHLHKEASKLVLRSTNKCDSHVLIQRHKDFIDGEEQKYLLTCREQQNSPERRSRYFPPGPPSVCSPEGRKIISVSEKWIGEKRIGEKREEEVYLQQNNQKSLEVAWGITTDILLQVIVVLWGTIGTRMLRFPSFYIFKGCNSSVNY